MSRNIRRLVLAALISAIVAPLCTVLLHQGAFGQVAAALNDSLYLDDGVPTQQLHPAIAVVTLPAEAAGRWQRNQHAEVIRALHEAGATAIGYDVVFELPPVPAIDPRGDAELIEAIRDARYPHPGVPLACPLSGDVERQPSENDVVKVVLATATNTQARDGDFPAHSRVVQPLPYLLSDEQTSQNLAFRGNVAVIPDEDDLIIRQAPVLSFDPENPRDLGMASLSYAAVQAYLGVQESNSLTWNTTLRRVLAAGCVVQLDEQYYLEINWALHNRASDRGQAVFTHEQVLAGEADLEGRLVFVGVVDVLGDFEELRAGIDQVVTPLDPGGMPGVFVHANAANTMLMQKFRHDAKGEATTIMVLTVLALSFAGMTMSPRFRPTITVFGLGALAILAWQFWYVPMRFDDGANLNQVWPNVAVLLTVAGVTGARYVTEERERRRVAGLFKQYVPDSVADDLLLSDRLAAAAEGERTEVTVLFCDLRGFTATAANLPPADVRAMLEVYYDHSTNIIQDHGGTVMQFVGDEVFAVFGAPLAQEDHAQRALDAALGMQAAATDINAELAPRGVSIAYGIGLNSGEVVAAHVGSKVHKQYAVVGQTVNVGARLCSQAEPGGIVLSKWTKERLSMVPELISLGSVSLKGVSDDPEPAKVVMPGSAPEAQA